MTRLTDDAGTVGRSASPAVRGAGDPTPHLGGAERAAETAVSGRDTAHSIERSLANRVGGGRNDATHSGEPALADQLGGRRSDAVHSGDPSLADRLAEGLFAARHSDATTCIAFPVPRAAHAGVVAAFPDAPMVVWSTADATVVGVGVAHEFRGHGATRYADIVAAARRISVSAAIGHPTWVPRIIGGVAFAPGAADQAPWRGFGDAWFALPRWTYSSDGWLVLAVSPDDASESGRWRAELDAWHIALRHRFVQQSPPALTAIDSGDSAAWRDGVAGIVTAIARGDYAKIVAARHAHVALAHDIRAADLLAELTAQHGECTRLLVHPGSAATFVAATPERLIRVEHNWVECDALAGSQPRGDAASTDSDAAELLASAKDRREHALVVDAIVSQLEHLGGVVKAQREPTIRSLRHVLHLHTPITARLAQARHVLELVEALHPTPAMGGTPTDAATAWIAANEPARGWYASPVGWFDLDGNGEFAVAIRCGLVTGNRIDVWAGAGIVAGSDPDRELAETDVKLRAILGALGVVR